MVFIVSSHKCSMSGDLAANDGVLPDARSLPFLQTLRAMNQEVIKTTRFQGQTLFIAQM